MCNSVEVFFETLKIEPKKWKPLKPMLKPNEISN